MNDNIVGFPDRGTQPEQTAIESDESPTVQALEFLLQEARGGRIKEMAMAYLLPDGSAMTAWSCESTIAMAGAIAKLQHGFLTELD